MNNQYGITPTTITAMQKTTKKVTTATSVEKVTLTSILNEVKFSDGSSVADVRSTLTKVKQSKAEAFSDELANARVLLSFREHYNCPLGDLKEALEESFGEVISLSECYKNLGFGAKGCTAKEAANHANKTIGVASAEREYADKHNLTLLAVEKKFRKAQPDVFGTRRYKDWCLGKAAKKDGKKAVSFETLTCEESGMKWVEKMLKRAQDPSNDLTLTELNRVLGLMATKVALADTEQAVAEALQA